MKRLLRFCLIASLCSAATSCDDSQLCPGVFIFSSFTLIFDDPEWTPAVYTIEVSYTVGTDPRAYTCSVSVPAFVRDRVGDGEDEDAGPLAVVDGGAPLDDGRPEFFGCTSAHASAPNAFGEVGRAIVLRFNETPEHVHVVVRNRGSVVADRNIAPDYETLGGPCQEYQEARERFSL